MYTLTRVVLGMVTVASLFMTISDTALAQGIKIGFIHDEKIKETYPEWVRAQEQIDIELKAWDTEATTKQTELEELIQEYDKQKLILSEDKKKEREAAIRAKRDALDAYTRQIYGPGGTGEKKQMELMSPLLDKINRAIQLVAEEGGYDVIFTLQSGLGYIKPIYDVTDKVLEQLEKIEE